MEDEIIDEEVIDTMGYDILEEMEWENDKIFDDFDYICGKEHGMDDEN